MKLFKKIRSRDDGAILLILIITLPFIITVALYYTQLSLTSSQVARFDQLHTEAQLAADAGADYAVEQISQNNNWTGTTGEVQLHSDSSLKTTYQASVTGDTTAKVVSVTGRTYWPSTASTPRRTVAIKVDLRPVTTANYSVVTGAGGLYMSNSSKVVGGSVFINGELVMSNSATIGLAIQPTDVKVAHQICPNPATAAFPRVCNSGENGQPISLSNTSHIYGTVTATNQTDGSNMTSPGLVAGSVAPQALPAYDRAAQKAAVTNNMTAANASCTGSQAKIWPANTKITGNVTLDHTCSVTVQGNVWITGDLSLSQTAQIKVDNALGGTRPVIMIDGSSGVDFSNGSQVTSNSSSTGVELITFYSTAACSPDCASVTGTDLATSRTKSTITLSNSSSGANTVFYAYWTRATLGNGGQIGAVIGQTIQLSNTATVTFGASAGVGSTIWVVKGYRKQ